MDAFVSPFLQTPRQPSHLFANRLRRQQARLVDRRAADRLFLAALPDDATAARISDLAGRLKIGHGLHGKLLKTEHLHVTLFHVGEGTGLRPAQVEEAKARASSVVMPSFKVAFDRVGSFRNGAFVLRGGDGMIGLEILHQRLNDAFDNRPAVARPFTPHVKLLRDREQVEEHSIQPIEWTVREVVLMHGLQGRFEHRQLARFALH